MKISLQQLETAGGISLLVVDEAHTIVQWGHDFRPAFQAIGDARKRLGNPPVLALTATATDDVQNEILHSLHMHDAVRINTGTDRTNLFFSVHPTVNNPAKFARILKMLEREKGTGIIYTASVRSADELYELPFRPRRFRRPLSRQDDRKGPTEVQAAFMRGDHKVMIATKAFGLGIDKPDIRFVYHFEFPDSLETYYQEAGRAGRDGDLAHAVLLYRLEDKRIQSFFLSGRYPRPSELESVYQSLLTQPESIPHDPHEAGLVDAIVAEAQEAESQEAESQEAERQEAESQEAERQGAGAAASSLPKVLGKRRTEVILNLLREAGLIERTPSGYTVVPDSEATQEQLTALLKTYIDRAARDQHHLAEMMHYAETPSCRTRVIRTYFGDHEGDPCLRCDNCAQEHAHRMPEPHLELLGRKPPQSAPIPEPEPVITPHQHVEVVATIARLLPDHAPPRRRNTGGCVSRRRCGPPH